MKNARDRRKKKKVDFTSSPLISQLTQCERNYVTLINPLFRPLHLSLFFQSSPHFHQLFLLISSLYLRPCSSLSIRHPHSPPALSADWRWTPPPLRMKRKWVTLLPFVEDFTENLRLPFVSASESRGACPLFNRSSGSCVRESSLFSLPLFSRSSFARHSTPSSLFPRRLPSDSLAERPTSDEPSLFTEFLFPSLLATPFHSGATSGPFARR